LDVEIDDVDNDFPLNYDLNFELEAEPEVTGEDDWSWYWDDPHYHQDK
jgi:hypothetical protein